jgi:hypothetical protein
MFRLKVVSVTAAFVIVSMLPTHVCAGMNLRIRSVTPPILVEKLHKPVSSELVATLKDASKKGLKLAVAPDKGNLKAISGPNLERHGKVGLLYIGADFCPYCAGQRWGLVLTLLRFGTFNGLQYMLSSSTDGYPNTPTVTFQNATYKSEYINFQAVEIEDRDRAKLMSLDNVQQEIYKNYDTPPYMPAKGGIPFVYLGGKYTLDMLIVLPNDLTDKNWKQIANAFATPNNRLFKSTLPKVNLLTAAICALDGGRPTTVCASPGVLAAKASLPKQSLMIDLKHSAPPHK